jgi:hypothetical protein
VEYPSLICRIFYTAFDFPVTIRLLPSLQRIVFSGISPAGNIIVIFGITLVIIKSMKIVMITILVAGIILFFPFPVGNSACLFGYVSGICFYQKAETNGGMAILNHYMRHFALFWWASIGMTAGLLLKWKKRKLTNE